MRGRRCALFCFYGADLFEFESGIELRHPFGEKFKGKRVVWAYSIGFYGQVRKYITQEEPLLILGGLWALVDVLRLTCKLVDGKAGFVIGSASFAQFPEGFESRFFFHQGFFHYFLAERGHFSVEFIPIGVFYSLVGCSHDAIKLFSLGGVVVYFLVVTFFESFLEPLEYSGTLWSDFVEVGKELSFHVLLAYPVFLFAWSIVIAMPVPVTLLNFPRDNSAAPLALDLRLEYGEMLFVLRVIA